MQLPNNTLPVTIGAVIGAMAITVIGLTNGWVITSSKMDTQLEESLIAVQASICAARAETFLAQSESTLNLEGYQAAARENREELARKYASPLHGEDDAESIVINACSRLLNKPHT